MEANEANIQQLVQCLTQTMNPDAAQRKAAEKFLLDNEATPG